MTEPTRDPKELVKTEAETVPPPDGGERAGCNADPEIMTELRQLSDRVGGPEQLRRLVDTMAGLQE